MASTQPERVSVSELLAMLTKASTAPAFTIAACSAGLPDRRSRDTVHLRFNSAEPVTEICNVNAAKQDHKQGNT